MVNSIIKSKCIFVENNKIETFFSNYILGLTIYKVYFQNNCFLQETRENAETSK